ncbi:MAG: hypothetical protein Q4C65_07320 [Eubacteriales bacterium]|nr:hypothetical protein [Eubacteriales bacterium]
MNSSAKPARNGFATASIVLGVIALVSTFSMTLIPAFFCGALSVMLGLLSRGNSRTMSGNALAGVAVSVCAIVINAALFVFSFYIVFSSPESRAQYWGMVNETYEQLTGMTADEILENYGIERYFKK